jgi:putative flavoprotein involved in K+ transport
MPTTEVLVIGAGHAGLAMSWYLTERGVAHVVLERGRLAERWRSARWDSFRLLTPSWLTRLPGWAYGGPEPDGFMTSARFVSHLEDYARSFGAPVVDRTTVLDVRAAAAGYHVRTDRGCWTVAKVVIATGYHARAEVPPIATDLALDLAQVTPAGYRGPGQLPGGAVLVVGASASGVQIADELAQAGRRVVLAVGAHTRLPRRYRNQDILWWLDRIGSLDRTIDGLPDAKRARREPSLQLAGTCRPVDLGALQERGVRLAGRLTTVDGYVVRFAGDLADSTAGADTRMRRVLADIDAYAASMPAPAPAGRPPQPVVPAPGPDRLDLRRAGVSSVVWATGFRPWYPWLRVPVLDRTGRIQHRRGVTAAPGLYAIGLRFQHRRSSTFIDGARHDAAYLADHIAARRRTRRPVAC